MYKPTVKSYFSGAGGMDVGLIQSGLEIIQSLEIDHSACQTLLLNGHTNVREMRIEDITVKSQQPSDILVGTYPCTKYSTIADVKGNRTGDDLFLHFFRHIAIEQPECYIVENVPGMRKFKVTMEAMQELPGYYINTLCPIDALNWLPQSRPRLILIGTRKPFRIEYPKTTCRPSLMSILEPKPNIEVPQYVINRHNGQYRDKPIYLDPSKPGSYARTLLANYGKDKSYQVVLDPRYPEGIRHLTVREYARLQGFPDWYKFYGNEQEQYKQIGNAVAVPVARWIGAEVMRYFQTIK